MYVVGNECVVPPFISMVGDSPMGAREFRDGAQDGLEVLEPLDPTQIASFDGLLTAMRKTAFGGRRCRLP